MQASLFPLRMHLCSDPSWLILPVQHLEAISIREPTTMQEYLWPVLLRSRNTVAIGPSRSGKTVAYLVAVISELMEGELYRKVCVLFFPLYIWVNSLAHICLLVLLDQCLSPISLSDIVTPWEGTRSGGDCSILEDCTRGPGLLWSLHFQAWHQSPQCCLLWA